MAADLTSCPVSLGVSGALPACLCMSSSACLLMCIAVKSAFVTFQLDTGLGEVASVVCVSDSISQLYSAL